MHVFVAGESTLARHPTCARHAEQQEAASSAGTVAMKAVVSRSVLVTVSHPTPSDAGAVSVQSAVLSTPLSRTEGLVPTTAWSLRPLEADATVANAATAINAVIMLQCMTRKTEASMSSVTHT